MRIVLIAPRVLPVPPIDYGGTERVIYYLAEELIRRGHDVILFAAKGSKSNAKLYEYPSQDRAKVLNFIIRHMPERVDIIHDHDGLVAKSNPPIPVILQSHGTVVSKKAQIPAYVSKTMLQTTGRNRGYYVHNGIAVRDYEFRDHKEDYLLFLGRMSQDKGIHHAIEVSQQTKRRLIIAGPAHEAEGKDYFHTHVKPHLSDQITYVGSVGGVGKRELLSKAYCVLFPSVCHEPFGLVPIEALASGTPVLGLKFGAVPEVLQGFPELLCDNVSEMASKVQSGHVFPKPLECLQYVEQHFSEKVMTDQALRMYRAVRKANAYQVFPDSEWSKRKRRLNRGR